MISFKEYQKKAHKTAIYPKIIIIRKDGTKKDISWVYPLIGYLNEVGELAGKFKKVIRDNNFVISKQMKKEIESELGDCEWYKAELEYKLKLVNDQILRNNLQKLKSRKKRKVLSGSGDHR